MKATLVVPLELPDDWDDIKLGWLEKELLDSVDDLEELKLDESRTYGLYLGNKHLVSVVKMPEETSDTDDRS